MDFRGFIGYLAEIGVADVLLPFIIVFTVTFAVLQKIKIFGKPEEGGKKYNTMVALVLGLAIVIPHILGAYPEGGDLVVIMNSFLPSVSIFAILIVMVMLIVGVFGYGFDMNKTGGSVIALLCAIIVVYIFGASANWWGVPGALSFVMDPDTQAFLIIIAVFGLIIWFVTRSDKPAGGDGGGFKKFLNEFFKESGK
ncbi:MAG TPA: hypothetical protein VJG90_01325 [Candidatus Nanoarchaeia archaeon]|nr:hypothetical protein [Candidatus Nanoarchaeia archaeon]